MRNIRLIIEYEGTNYSGWQVQTRHKQKKTVQEILEKALAQILQEKIKVIGSGRTDAGVHSLGQTANFKTKSKLDCDNIQRALNSILPKDIRIREIEQVRADFHARFSARSKIYRYTIVNHSFASPFLRRWAYLVRHPLNLRRMRSAAKYLLGKHNFRSFQAADKKERNSVRTIKWLDIRRDGDLIHINIEADGFLYRMVRNIAGTLIEVGRGRRSAENIKTILKAKNRIYAGSCAPARGLCLMEVKYKK
jgi:tRNA pseudouridine38-40 synthase